MIFLQSVAVLQLISDGRVLERCRPLLRFSGECGFEGVSMRMVGFCCLATCR
jgi:hypothetical protein